MFCTDYVFQLCFLKISQHDVLIVWTTWVWNISFLPVGEGVQNISNESSIYPLNLQLRVKILCVRGTSEAPPPIRIQWWTYQRPQVFWHEQSAFQSVAIQAVDWHDNSGPLFSLFFSSSTFLLLRHNFFS